MSCLFKLKFNQFTGLLFVFIVVLTLSLTNPLFSGERVSNQSQVTDQKKEEEQLARARTEEIVVTAPSPEEKALASVFIIQPAVLNLLKTRNMAELLSFAPGTYVTTGAKAESHVKIRGMDNDKSTLLLDGIPVYEPYFNLYDLRTIPTLDVERVQVTKGPSSVLYGANTMGGIIEVMTRRPQESGLELRTRMGPTSSFSFAGNGTYAAPGFALKLTASHEESDGFKYNDAGIATYRSNSDYRNNYFSGKFYFFPDQKSEILFQASFYDSSYGVPPATAFYSPRYWRFKDWERLIFGLGGTFSFFKTGTLKVRTYYVNYYNVLDAFSDATYSSLSWESVYKNFSAGAFILGTIYPRANHEVRFSLNGRLDKVKQQASETSPWENYEHRTYSFGLEDEWKLTARWYLTGGFNFDFLQKLTGASRTSLNPVVGLRFLPADYLAFHLSYSQKSRFPSMRSLYSSTSGNPDLRDELGRTIEFGTTYFGWINSSLALFSSEYRDLITAIRQPDGTRLYVNVGQARINGFEVEANKGLGHFNIQLLYTFLDARNITDDRKLELVPESQISAMLNYMELDNFSLAIWLLCASQAEILISQNIVTVPAYLTANLSLEKYFRSGSFFLKVENLFNRAYFTEPGYPVSCRRIEVGFGFRTGL
ncbi:MAG: TonB-dependent receptor [Candidatus Saccharicenans sp.]|nr:TonB-dependent receptor [Candidatus Saccharicenans sp.]